MNTFNNPIINLASEKYGVGVLTPNPLPLVWASYDFLSDPKYKQMVRQINAVRQKNGLMFVQLIHKHMD